MNFQTLTKKLAELDQSSCSTDSDELLSDNAVSECGMEMQSLPSKQSDSVTMNVSMNGSGAGGIRDLMNVLKDIQDGADDHDDIDIGHDSAPDVLLPKDLDSIDDLLDDDYSNEPDEEYGSVDMITGTGDDLHSKGSELPKVNGGGNPAANSQLKMRLENLYHEIKHR